MIVKINSKRGDPTLFWIATLAVGLFAANTLAERYSDNIDLNRLCSATVAVCATSGLQVLNAPPALASQR